MKKSLTKKITASVSLLLVASMVLAGCGSSSSSTNLPDETTEAVTEAAVSEEESQDTAAAESTGPKSYTFHDYSSSLVTDWSPHTYKYTLSSTILTYIAGQFVEPTIEDSENSIFQYAWDMTTYIKDVTADNQEDLVKYNVEIPEEFDSYLDVTEGYVMEIGLNPDACWENGEKITADTYVESLKLLLDPSMQNYKASMYWSGTKPIAGAQAYNQGDNDDFDSVGLYKVDDYTIHYVLAVGKSEADFISSLTNVTWLVYEPYYTAGLDTTGELVTTNYNTSVETTMSYGPYRLESYQEDKQMVFTQNENWWGWEEDEDGTLVSYTDFLVDGEHVRQYYPTKIVIDLMTDDAAKQLFLNGEMSRWVPSSDELTVYGSSDRLFKSDLTYTSRIIFNCDLDSLKIMDESKGNTNSVVLSNINFRHAMSLAMDRNELVTATDGYKPCMMLINNLYYYDLYNDPSSNVRQSDEGMQALCDFYGVEWGEGTPYATLKDAASSITGYNVTAANELFKQACEELENDGLYTPGEDIVIRVAVTNGAMDSTNYQFMTLLNNEINAAAEGSGFGTITFEGVDNLANRYTDTENGEYAMCLGAWSGRGDHPFDYLKYYLDPDGNDVNEIGCFDPTTEEWTIEVDGEEITMTIQNWSKEAASTVGMFADMDVKERLKLVCELEKRFLECYYCIPYAQQVSNEMMSYQAQYYTDVSNVLYDLGGLRLIQYNYDDDEWAAYVESQGGTLNYE